MTDIPPSDQNSDDLPATVRDRHHRLTSDELIALFVALTSIGALLFWLLGWKKPFFDPGSLSANQTVPSADVRGDGGNSASKLDPALSGTDAGVSSPGNASGNGTVAAGTIAGATIAGQAPSAEAETRTEPESDRKTVARSPVETAPSPSAEATMPAGDPSVIASPSPTAPIAMAPTSPDPASPAPTATTPAPTVESPGQPKNFSDVPDSFWAHKYIRELSSRGVLGGFPDNRFKPDQPITRAEFAGIVGRAFEKPRSRPAIVFKDVAKTDPVANAVTEATQTGFMSGYPNQVFNPNQQIPRHQMQVAIATGLQLAPQGDPVQALTPYVDAKEVPKWATTKLATAINAGIIGEPGDRLEPNQPATRADAAAYIYQALVKEGKIKP
jgi:S-layer homology domain